MNLFSLRHCHSTHFSVDRACRVLHTIKFCFKILFYIIIRHNYSMKNIINFNCLYAEKVALVKLGLHNLSLKIQKRQMLYKSKFILFEQNDNLYNCRSFFTGYFFPVETSLQLGIFLKQFFFFFFFFFFLGGEKLGLVVKKM